MGANSRKNLFALLPLTKDLRASGHTGLRRLHHGRRRAIITVGRAAPLAFPLLYAFRRPHIYSSPHRLRPSLASIRLPAVLKHEVKEKIAFCKLLHIVERCNRLCSPLPLPGSSPNVSDAPTEGASAGGVASASNDRDDGGDDDAELGKALAQKLDSAVNISPTMKMPTSLPQRKGRSRSLAPSGVLPPFPSSRSLRLGSVPWLQIGRTNNPSRRTGLSTRTEQSMAVYSRLPTC